MMYNNCSGAIRWQIHDFLSDGNSNICSISTVCVIFANLAKCQNFDLENEGQGLEIFDFI